MSYEVLTCTGILITKCAPKNYILHGEQGDLMIEHELQNWYAQLEHKIVKA